MEGERIESDTRVTLPEELVGKILSMVPFPQIFKGRVLSKAWQARFSPISSQDDENKMYIATWFQEQVGEWSSKWKTYHPFCNSLWDFVVREPDSFIERSLPLLFLPRHCFSYRSIWRIEGSLLLVRNVRKTYTTNASFTRDLYVANILTQSWKRLPPQPHQKSTCQMLIYTKPTYRVIDFEEEEDWASNHFFAHIYDSYLEAWSSIEVSKSSDFTSSLSSWVHLDGVLYRVIGPSSLIARGLHAFSVKEGTSEMLKMSSSIHISAHGMELGVYNDSLLMLVYSTDHIVTLVKIDLGSQSWLEVARGDPIVRFGMFYEGSFFGSEGPFYGNECSSFPKEVVYILPRLLDVQDEDYRLIRDVRKDLSQRPFRFQPGLNPFVKV